MKKHQHLRNLIIISMLVAITIICVRFLSFDTGIIRISLGFVPISVAGMILGPVGGGITAVLADFLGMLINSKGAIYFFPFAISEFLYGFGYGIFLHKKQPSVLKLSLCIAVQFIIINLFLTSFWLYLYSIFITGTPKAFWVIFVSRITAAIISLPIHVIFINVLQKYLSPQLSKYVS